MSGTHELWQEYDFDFLPLHTKGRDPRAGNPKSSENNVYVATAIIWLYRFRENGLEVLFQQRSQYVDGNPLKWDISAGGHVNVGETALNAALRELREEIGVTAKPKQLQFGFYCLDGYGTNVIRNYYFCDWTDQPDDFHFNDHEVAQVKWVPLSNFQQFIEANAKEPLKQARNEIFTSRLTLLSYYKNYRKAQLSERHGNHS